MKGASNAYLGIIKMKPTILIIKYVYKEGGGWDDAIGQGSANWEKLKLSFLRDWIYVKMPK